MTPIHFQALFGISDEEANKYIKYDNRIGDCFGVGQVLEARVRTLANTIDQDFCEKFDAWLMALRRSRGLAPDPSICMKAAELRDDCLKAAFSISQDYSRWTRIKNKPKDKRKELNTRLKFTRDKWLHDLIYSWPLPNLREVERDLGLPENFCSQFLDGEEK